MQQSESAPAGATLDFWTNEVWSNGVQTEQLEDMQRLFVRTRNSLYEITILDRWSGDILVRGGQFFPQLTPARLAGATLGSSFLKMRGIYVGFRTEIQAGDQRIVTTRVATIAVEAPDARYTLPS
jgi:hypothetical protein